MFFDKGGLECVEYDLRIRGNVIGSRVANGGEDGPLLWVVGRQQF